LVDFRGLRLATLFTVDAVCRYQGAAFNKHMGISCPVKENHMKTAIKANRSVALAGAAATLALAAMGFAGAAQARDNVSFSVGIGVPGVQVGVTNAYPVYQQPVYVQPAPVY
jgi:hypothetical protein